MAVLLQFNVSDSWTVAQLEENTQIKPEFLIQVSQNLIKSKLLICDEDENEVNMNSTVSLNLQFKK